MPSHQPIQSNGMSTADARGSSDHFPLIVCPDAEAAAASAADWMAERLADAVQARGAATVAVSGGGTAPPLFEALMQHRLPWDHISVWQVDERVVPDGHPERNASQLDVLGGRTHPMPVTADDLDQAALDYGDSLPEQFDVVHLGVGADGHTASWPPGDRAVVSSNRPVEVIDEFNGFRRMTLTPKVVNAARSRLILTLGSDHAEAVTRWRDGDRSLPVAEIDLAEALVVVDEAAAGSAGSRTD
jgi:6-phosphogluconolactonase/glucosamine-6-phosphate isomerase/deaminase